jgi:hypothetical protein
LSSHSVAKLVIIVDSNTFKHLSSGDNLDEDLVRSEFTFEADIGRIISKDIYILCPIQKTDIPLSPYHFFERDMLRDMIS